MQSTEKKSVRYSENAQKRAQNSSLTYWKTINNRVENLRNKVMMNLLVNNLAY